MTQQLFKVIFRGEIAPGFTRAQVRDNLQKMCNYDAEMAEKLLSGRAFTLKTNADQATAERIRTILARAGAICTIEPMGHAAAPVGTVVDQPTQPAPARPPVPPLPPPDPQETAAGATAAAGGSAQVRWFLRELPKLVNSGVLTEETSERLRLHYASAAPPRRTSLALVICAALGALLVGLGIILIFAHNWPELSRPARTFLSFSPLVLAQALTAWVILHRSESVPWREGAAAFLIAAVGASIALVGQTYHLSDDLGRFLLTWMVLCLPLVFLLRSAMAAALYWIGITAWAILSPYDRGTMALFWLLLSLPGWLLWHLRRQWERQLARTWLLWVLSLCLVAVVGFAGQGRAYRLLPIHYGLLFGLYYLADRCWMAGEKFGRRPLLLLGSAGTVVLCLALTFEGVAREAALSLRVEHFFRMFGSATFSLLLACYLFLLFYLLVRRRELTLLVFGAVGLLMLPIQLASRGFSGQVTIFLNAYLLLLGGTALVAGLRQGRLAKVNGALGIFGLLLTARFFDTGLPFTVKGIAFVAVGISFLGVNLLLRRHMREVAA